MSDQATQQAGKFLAGAAEIVITPPIGAPTLGTIQRSTSVNDELYGRALVLSDGKRRIVILSLDLIGMDFGFSDDVRDAIHERTGIATILVHCTHNHSAPFTIPWSVVGSRWLSGPGKAWRNALPLQLAGLVAQAESEIRPVKLRAGRAPVKIGCNRRFVTGEGTVMKPNPDGPIVPWVDVLCVDGEDGAPAAVLFSHAAHPVIIHGASRALSAEFPGFAVRKLKKLWGSNVVPLFGQAFAADINGEPLRGGIAAAERAGEVLAEAVVQAASVSQEIPFQEFSVTTANSWLPLQVLPGKEACTQALRTAEERLARRYGATPYTDEQLWDMQDEAEIAKSQTESTAVDDVQPMEGKAWWMTDTVLCLRDLLHKIEQNDTAPLRFDAHLVRLGKDWSLLTATHELFSEYQLQLDKVSPAKYNMMLAYTNGCESYVPMDKDYALGGYEASSFPEDGAALRYRHRRALRPGTEKLVMEKLRSLWGMQ